MAILDDRFIMRYARFAKYKRLAELLASNLTNTILAYGVSASTDKQYNM